MTNLSTLKDLLAAATPGPWQSTQLFNGKTQIFDTVDDSPLCLMSQLDGGSLDAQLIVAMRNCLPRTVGGC